MSSDRVYRIGGSIFNRWLQLLKKSDSLDLTRHQPADFAGKIVVLNEREYVIGANVRISDQGFSHQLINRMSGLCLHIIQIRPEYRQAPDKAWTISRDKETVTAHLRDFERVEAGRPDMIGVLTARQGCEGSFELHEIGWGMYGHDMAPAAVEAIGAANALAEKGDHQGAITAFERVVDEHPNHTVALNNLAGSHFDLGQCVEALDPIGRAVEIEPDYSKYRGSHLIIAVNCPARWHAAKLYDDLKQQFPHVGDYDYYGIHAYLGIGKPDRARAILQQAKLPEAEAQSLGASVEGAVQARGRYDAFRSEVSANGKPYLLQEWVLPFLEEVHAAYDVDPDIQASLGFRLRAAGEYKRAAAMLLRALGGIGSQLNAECWANAAYCLLMLGDWPRAMDLLDRTMRLLEMKGMANPVDIPGIVEWISDQCMITETMKPSAAEVLSRALLECPDKSLITPAIEKMAALLRQFAARMDGPVRK